MMPYLFLCECKVCIRSDPKANTCEYCSFQCVNLMKEKNDLLALDLIFQVKSFGFFVCLFVKLLNWFCFAEGSLSPWSEYVNAVRISFGIHHSFLHHHPDRIISIDGVPAIQGIRLRYRIIYSAIFIGEWIVKHAVKWWQVEGELQKTFSCRLTANRIESIVQGPKSAKQLNDPIYIFIELVFN